MLIFYPKLPNGNILWTCDNCGDTAEIRYGGTNAVSIYCMCDESCHPKCNGEWYSKGLYWKRIPLDRRNFL